MFVQLDLSRSRRRRRWWLLPLVLAAVLLAGPWLAAVVPGTAASIDRFVGARYTAQIDALQTENFTLPMPVQIKIESTDSSPNRAMTPSRTVFLFPEGETVVLLIFSAGTPPPPPSPRKALSRRDVRATASAFQSARPKDVPFRPPESAAARRSGAGRCCPGKDNALKAGCSRRPAPPRARTRRRRAWNPARRRACR